MGPFNTGSSRYALQAGWLEGVPGRHERHDVRAQYASRADDGRDAQFERDLLSERVKSGLAAARARGKKLGRQPAQRPKSERLAPKVLHAIVGGKSYRWIARDLGISKNTVADIVKRHRANP